MLEEDRSILGAVTYEDGDNIHVGNNLLMGLILGPEWVKACLLTLPGVTGGDMGYLLMGDPPLKTIFRVDIESPPRARLSPEAAAIIHGRIFVEGCPYMRND